jgi:hypothetical protein
MALIFKGNLWSRLPGLIKNLPEELKDKVLAKLGTILKENSYIPAVAEWICANINTVDEDTLNFIEWANSK